jgi:hypothetical protein
MLKSKSILAVLFGTLSVLVLGGCLTNDEPSGGGSDFSFTAEVDVLNITEPQASAAGTITTRSIDTYCDEGDLVTDTSIETSKYAISGGHMLLWSQGDCLATRLTGSSSTIVGTWTAASLVAVDSVPAAFRPAICNEDEFEEEDAELFENVSVEYKISSTKIQGKTSGTVCFASTFASSFEDSSISGFEVVSEDCSTVKVRNLSTNKVATITSEYKDGSAIVKFAYGKSVCTGSIYLGLSNAAPTCSEDEDEDESLDEYSMCTFQSGFYGEFDLEKQASLAKKMSLALKPAAGPF